MKNILLILLLTLFVFTAQAVFSDNYLAQDEKSLVIPGEGETLSHTAASDYSSGDLVRTGVVLVISVALIYAVFLLVRRFVPSGTLRENGEIKILSSRGMGTGKAIHVVEIAGRYFVIGASENSLTCISELTEEEGRKIENSPAEKVSVAGTLKKIMEKRERLK